MIQKWSRNDTMPIWPEITLQNRRLRDSQRGLWHSVTAQSGPIGLWQDPQMVKNVRITISENRIFPNIVSMTVSAISISYAVTKIRISILIIVVFVVIIIMVSATSISFAVTNRRVSILMICAFVVFSMVLKDFEANVLYVHCIFIVSGPKC